MAGENSWRAIFQGGKVKWYGVKVFRLGRGVVGMTMAFAHLIAIKIYRTAPNDTHSLVICFWLDPTGPWFFGYLYRATCSWLEENHHGPRGRPPDFWGFSEIAVSKINSKRPSKELLLAILVNREVKVKMHGTGAVGWRRTQDCASLWFGTTLEDLAHSCCGDFLSTCTSTFFLVINPLSGNWNKNGKSIA